jgi:malate synthase
MAVKKKSAVKANARARAGKKRSTQKKTGRKTPKIAQKATRRAPAKPRKAPRKTALKTISKPTRKTAHKTAHKTARKTAPKTTRKTTVRKVSAAQETRSKQDTAQQAAKSSMKPRRRLAKASGPAAKGSSPLAPEAASGPTATKRKTGSQSAKRPIVTPIETPEGVIVHGRIGPRYHEILTPGALAFLADLHRTFDAERRQLLAARTERQKQFDAGSLPNFLFDTRSVREGDWRIAPVPADLLDRRVEITGPVDRKMIVNALNSGANVFMADFEDASAPTWSNVVEGQINLMDRWDGKIDFTEAATGKHYKLSLKPALLMIRPRGWHLPEVHLCVDGDPISGALFDFGLYMFHNAHKLIANGATPAVYLPKLESHLEARLWNEVFNSAERSLGIPPATLKATVLIETLPAAFEMDEIIYELKDHMAGLNCGRWDYIFSFIKRLGKNPDYLTPDRTTMVMGEAFLSAYAQLLIKTCHRRGAFAMGGMAAQIPVKNDPSANAAAFAKVRADKEREVSIGHDGTWVAHPDLVPIAQQVFERLLPATNQLERQRDDVQINQADLLHMHAGVRTERGLRENIRVGVQYIEAWLRGRGAVPLYNLMEDAATAEISRAQIWQWLLHRAKLEDGRAVTPELFQSVFADEMAKVKAAVGTEAYDKGRFAEASKLFVDMSLAPEFAEFLTLPAYALLEQGDTGSKGTKTLMGSPR